MIRSHVACLTATSISLIHADASDVDDHVTLFQTVCKDCKYERKSGR